MVNIAAAQIEVIYGSGEESIRGNFTKILEYIAQADRMNIDIICFPDACLNADENASIDEQKYITKICEWCKKFRIWCIFGTYLHEKGTIRNVSFLISPDGNIVYEYDKVHLWKTEMKAGICPGKKNRIIDTEFGKISIISSWDIAYPEYLKGLAKAGARIIFCPSFTSDCKQCKEYLEKVPYVRAFESVSYFVFCDAYSKDTYSISSISHPLRTLETINIEGIIHAEIDPDEIDALRDHYNNL